ncbi:hypothetical protein DRO49_05515 [Candidatus Bathyarchaeota archaeon]|nr:MAG: hypothetical protein DRO49_05515 [Candidatus Bathyarchaeota archaeon]
MSDAIPYCLLCKRELRRCKSFAEAFEEIDTHLLRRHRISWISPTGIDIREYSTCWVKYAFRKNSIEDHEKRTISLIRLELAKYRTFYMPDDKREGIITDVFAVFSAREEVRKSFLSILRKRKRGKWIYPQKFKAMRKHSKLVGEYYQTQRGRELHHKCEELKRKYAKILEAFVEQGLTEGDFHQLLKKLKEEEEREERERIKEEREREWKALTPQEKLGLYPEALCGQRPTTIRKKLFGV